MDQRLHAEDAWALWDDGPLDGAFDLTVDGNTGAAVVRAVHRPWLFHHAPARSNGRALLILGGGGYTQLMVGREGVAVARWLTGLGFHAYVLVHRFPDADTGPLAPVADARQAMRMIAARDHDAIGVVGLSSGGHLAAALLGDGDEEDGALRPAVAVIGYAPISTNAAGRHVIADKPPLEPPAKQALYDRIQPDVQLAPVPPPAFLVYSANDPVVPIANAYRLAQALTDAGGPTELHVFADAPHGFAMDTVGLPVSRWPALAETWMRQIGFLPG